MTRVSPAGQMARALRWALLLAALAVSSLFVAWHSLAAADFGYSLWYDALGIEETIATYGPRNPDRADFVATDRAERERLFGRIVDAIHAEGAGLAELRYHNGDGESLGRLLTEPEIVHLQDVARLVARFERAGWVALAVLALLVTAAVLRGEQPPAGRVVAGATAAVVALGAAAVVLAGPVEIFYALHEWIFPTDHEWFFYYEESVMSLMMQAPNLFGPIAASWVALTVVLGGAVWYGLVRVLRYRARD